MKLGFIVLINVIALIPVLIAISSAERMVALFSSPVLDPSLSHPAVRVAYLFIPAILSIIFRISVRRRSIPIALLSLVVIGVAIAFI